MRNFISAPLVVAFLFVSFSAQAFSISGDGKSASISFLTYNLWGAPFAKKRKQRFPRAAEKIAEVGADIVALEEVFEGCLVPNEPKYILRGTQYPYYVEGPMSKKFPRCVDSGLMILSKFPIQERAEVKYKSCAGADCFSHKGVVYARIQVPVLGDIDVYATHTNASDKHADVRLKQTKQIVDFVRQHSGDGKRPVVFMGDLNAAPDSEEIRMLRDELSFRDSHQEFVETHVVTQTEYDGFTCDPLRNANLFSRPHQGRKRIDYIFVRDPDGFNSPVEIAKSRMMFEERGYRNRQLSDHFGVISNLEIRVDSPFVRGELYGSARSTVNQ